MPRPPKSRKINALPKNTAFGPASDIDTAENAIHMTVDEYEAIRLIDYEGLNQEECAVQMDVARTTAQRIYNSGKLKLAASLVESRFIKIEGGEYEVCPNRMGTVGGRRRRRGGGGKGRR